MEVLPGIGVAGYLIQCRVSFVSILDKSML